MFVYYVTQVFDSSDVLWVVVLAKVNIDVNKINIDKKLICACFHMRIPHDTHHIHNPWPNNGSCGVASYPDPMLSVFKCKGF